MKLTDSDFIETGFTAQTKMQLGEWVSTGVYKLPGFKPEPQVDFTNKFTGYGRIGSQQYNLRNREDLDKFVEKSVPLFCEKI